MPGNHERGEGERGEGRGGYLGIARIAGERPLLPICSLPLAVESKDELGRFQSSGLRQAERDERFDVEQCHRFGVAKTYFPAH